MNELICKLSEFESIKIITEEHIDFNQIDFCCSEVGAYFSNKQKSQLCIGQDSADSFFTALISNLKKNIDNELQLHEQCYEVNIEGYHEEMRDKIHQETDKIIQEHTSDIDLPF